MLLWQTLEESRKFINNDRNENTCSATKGRSYCMRKKCSKLLPYIHQEIKISKKLLQHCHEGDYDCYPERILTMSHRNIAPNVVLTFDHCTVNGEY